MILLITLILGVSFLLNSNFKKNNLDIDIEECENFEYHETRAICYAYFLQNHSLCELTANLKSLCYLFSTLKIKNIRECYRIKDETGRAACISGFAYKTQNPQICNILKKPFLIENCLIQFSPHYKLFKKELCNYINHQSSRFTCLAVVTNNISYCNRITTEIEERNLCFSILKNEPSFCKSDSCISILSLYYNNLTLCREIKPPLNSQCIGILTKDLKECEKIKYGGIPRDLCKLYVIYAKELSL